MRTPKAWKQKEVEKMISLYDEGYTVKEITALLGRTYASVHSMLYMYSNKITKPHSRKWTTQEVEKLLELEKSGMSRCEIAKRMNRTTMQVNSTIYRYKRG